MRAGRNGSPDQIQERYLGEIAPLLAAARKVESLSPVQKKQVRNRILRTLFRTHSLPLRFRLTPVLVGVGLLAGGAAFATAEHLGWIHRVDHKSPNPPAEAAANAHKRTLPRPKRAVEQGSVGVQELAAGEASTGQETPAQTIEPARTVASQEPNHGARVARAAATSFAKRLGPAEKVALATPYLADPVGAMPPLRSAAALGSPEFVPTTLPAFQSEPSVPASPLPARRELAPPAASPTVASVAPPRAETPNRRLPGDPVLFGQALRKLRSEGDPTAALTVLQEHAQAYPRSALASERGALEVEALLALHRDREALQRLDGMALDKLPRSGERFVVRGELRAAARRWQEAKADFDRALSRVSGSPAWYERALWGRGVSHLRCGEQEPGMADIERYHDLYPKGRFAAEASRFFTGR